ncbi:VaFE repeat-containing surface-anchored protein [Micrococcales bacterium 31B]|nr:VaFE repeat-containing surface-anchored protein [Micrococcales bacterium 31B]
MAFALAGTGTAIALAQTTSEAAAQSFAFVSGTAKAADGTQNVPLYSKANIVGRYNAPGNWEGVIKSYFVDPATGRAVGVPFYTAVKAGQDGVGNYRVALSTTPELAGKKLVVVEGLYEKTDIQGTWFVPTGIRAGATALATSNNLSNAAMTVQVGPQVATTTGTTTTVNVPNPTGTPTVTNNATTGASISTVATDNADGDKSVTAGGRIKDVVNYTGLHVGSVYVLHTQLFDKTTGQLVNWTGAKIFAPSASNGSETVTIPVPAGSEGHTFVVYQTIWAGADALVGKHLNKVNIRAGATPVVRDNNPDNLWETVVVPGGNTGPTLPVCTVSGFVWKDSNNNGIMDAGEEKVPGVQAALYGLTAGQNNYPGTALSLPGQTTDANGYYKFTVPGELCGRVYVDFNQAQYPAGWTPFGYGESDLKTDDLASGKTFAVDVMPGQNIERVDAGLHQAGGTVSGVGCSPYLAGLPVSLVDSSFVAVQKSTFDAQGRYVFKNVPAGTYSLRFGTRFTWGQPSFSIQTGGNVSQAQSFVAQTSQYWYNTGDTVRFTVTSNGDTTFNDICGVFESPLVLDLNGNGAIDTSAADDQTEGAAFDLFNTGEAVASGWTAGGDGFLVRPNADGTVTSGKNLFGGSLGEGFAQLAALDADHNGVVEARELDGLAVWVDANNDHVSQPGEIQPLAAHGIESLNVDYTNAPVANNGNVVIEHGTATTAAGGSVVVGDAYFQVTGALSAANQDAVAASSAASAQQLSTLPAAEQSAIAAAYASALAQ